MTTAAAVMGCKPGQFLAKQINYDPRLRRAALVLGLFVMLSLAGDDFVSHPIQPSGFKL